MAVRRVLSWLVALLLLAAVAAAAAVWVLSERHLRSFPRPPPFAQAIPTDAAAIARGEHLLNTRGCKGCHGAQLEGQLFYGTPAPGLAALARTASAAELEAAIRHGIGRDGKALYTMPAFSFVHLNDADLADLIAYLRQAPLPPQPDLPEPSLAWRVRLDLALGRDGAVPHWLPQVPTLKHQAGPDASLARGE
ncbi:cytochrome c [Pelomonas sp. SE-A7]|uniref:c-type cytochrome n=1 Tax=Pelomonas sp. SE-A7 TaxID=3054953 RepID=UPI00259D3088|nr:cytochrome c [Pelomonas sp. SE-A7]MDM4766596.1 cytochrome c [Pelomonas sp. SE-A7]